MHITVDMLREKSACKDQVELFEQTFPAGMNWPADLDTAHRAGLNTAWGAVEFGLSGVCEAWHYNGQLRYRTPYEHGKRHGVCEVWYPDGRLRSREHYEHGKLHGVREVWRDNGRLISRTPFEHGERHGVFEAWHTNGQLWFRDHYEHGELVSEEKV